MAYWPRLKLFSALALLFFVFVDFLTTFRLNVVALDVDVGVVGWAMVKDIGCVDQSVSGEIEFEGP